MPFSKDLLIGASGNQGGGFSPIACRFDASDADEMARTIGAPTNVDKWTCSWWQERTTSSFYEVAFAGRQNGTSYDNIFHNASDNTLRLEAQDGSSSYSVYTNGGYVHGTWRNYVIQYDSTQGTAGNRVKFFINGSQSAVSTRYNGQPASGRNSILNTENASFNIGHSPDYNGNANSKFSEFAFIDGTIVAASVFAEDNGGTWSAKDFAENVTFGNNGFYLKFQNSAALGEDSSGNDNDFSLANIVAGNQVKDDVPPSV